MKNGLVTGVALLDYSGAFDLVDHDILTNNRFKETIVCKKSFFEKMIMYK